MDKRRKQVKQKGKKEKVEKSKRWGSEWTREKRGKGEPRPHTGRHLFGTNR